MEENRKPGPKCSCCRELIYPSFSLFGNTISLNWDAHLPLRRDEWPLTAAALRPQLARLRDNTGRSICPALAPGVGIDLPELRCFDPNTCDCVRFEGSENVDWHLCSRLETNKGGHTDLTKRLYPPRALTKTGPKCESALRKHNISPADGASCYGPEYHDIKIQPCHSSSLCLTVSYVRGMRARSGIYLDPTWYQALDPGSYSLRADSDGFGVYWCRQKQCRNYYGRIPGFPRIF